jgi:hypothetical protein
MQTCSSKQTVTLYSLHSYAQVLFAPHDNWGLGEADKKTSQPLGTGCHMLPQTDYFFGFFAPSPTIFSRGVSR